MKRIRSNPVTLHPSRDQWEGVSRGVRLSSLPQRELAQGTEHELEHSRSRLVARRTAADHLVEDPKYYTHLKAMEAGRRSNPSHTDLVRDALWSWKGDPVTMKIFLEDVFKDRAPSKNANGSEMRWREQAEAFLWEAANKSRPTPALYRGSHQRPGAFEAWSTSRRIARGWAGRNGGAVWTLPAKKARGLRLSDYLGPDAEHEWIVPGYDARVLGRE